MREEVNKWFRQAEEDYDSAKSNFDIGKYYLVAFLCQQTVEKALKALIIHKKKTKIEGHSLVYLGKEVDIPQEFMPKLKQLSPQYFLSRYPDASEEIPYELYDKENTYNFIKFTGEVLKWIKSQFK